MSVEPANPGDVSLNRLFPWLRLFRAVGISFDRKKLFLAALGLLLLHGGWYILGLAFPHSLLRVAGEVRPLAPLGGPPRAAYGLEPENVVRDLAEPVNVVIGPFLDVFS